MPEIVAREADRVALSFFENAGALSPTEKEPRTWLARDDAAGGSVLVRRLRPDIPKARLTQALGFAHPHVVRMRRWFTVGGQIYVVRDVVRGRNLKQQLAGVALKHSPELLEKLLLPVLSVLEAAHNQNVAHGGLRAENVLIADDGRILVSDFAISDPASPQNAPLYNGSATVANDIKAAGKLIADFLPVGGPFASDVVRRRVAGILERCESIQALRETLMALDTLANAPVPTTAAPLAPATPVPEWIGPPPLPDLDGAETPTQEEPERSVTIDEPVSHPAPWVKRTPTAGPIDAVVPKPGAAQLTWRFTETNGVRVSRGGGGPATMIITNEGGTPLSVRMVGTQHGWLNVRQTELPITLPPGAAAPIDFAISATKLAAGEYRSEIYLSANAGGRNAEDLRSGWFKHTATLRVIVEPDLAGEKEGSKPPYPHNAPNIPAPPGCGILFVVGLTGIGTVLAWSLRYLTT